jgi:hypothetical protein
MFAPLSVLVPTHAAGAPPRLSVDDGANVEP